MKLYHASTVEVVFPDIVHSRKYLDFGRGFYLTSIKEQAIKYGERFLRRGKTATLIDEGVADLQCRSDKYLASEIWREHCEN